MRFTDIVPIGQDRIVGRTFKDHDFRGPTVVFVVGKSGFVDCGFGGAGNTPDEIVESLLWEVDPKSRPWVTGAIVLIDCTFINCTFEGIGFAGDAIAMAKMRAHVTPPPPVGKP